MRLREESGRGGVGRGHDRTVLERNAESELIVKEKAMVLLIELSRPEMVGPADGAIFPGEAQENLVGLEQWDPLAVHLLFGGHEAEKAYEWMWALVTVGFPGRVWKTR